MDRLAYQNMTIKNKIGHAPTMDQYSQPTGQLTSKSKINNRVNNYYLERQTKNLDNYNEFVSALNSNILEDQCRTTANNDQYMTEQPTEDNFQRVYHPTLLTEPEKDFNNADRCGLGTRDRQINAVAKNKNTSHLITPMPKLNYPQGYDKLNPISMDMSSQIESQFVGLTNPVMDQQIALLSKNSQKSNSHMNPNMTDELMRPTHGNYNSQTDFMNQQLYQLSTQIPPQRSLDGSRFLDFQRPISSNTKPLYTPFQIQPQTQTQIPIQPQVSIQPQVPVQPQLHAKKQQKKKKLSSTSAMRSIASVKKV